MKPDLISRRSFLSVVGAVGAAAALTACGGAVSSTASSAAASSEAASSEAAGESVELIVFAAASVTETLKSNDPSYTMPIPDEVLIKNKRLDVYKRQTQIIPGEFKGARFRKGHIIQPEDIPVLLSIGKENLYVWEKKPSIFQ